jgi:chaperonin GroES
MNKLMPEGVRILLDPQKVESKTEGGIYLPEQVKEDEQYATVVGTVIAIGPNADVMFEDGPLDVGDRITWAKFGGVIVDHDGEKCRVINDEDVIAKVV